MAYLLRVGRWGFVNRLGRSGYQKQERGLQKTETLFRQHVPWSDIGEAPLAWVQRDYDVSRDTLQQLGGTRGFGCAGHSRRFVIG